MITEYRIKAFYKNERQMIKLFFSTLIHRPVKQVFDFISTPQNDVQWQHGALAAFQTSEGSNGTGTLFGSLGHFMGRRLQSNFEVTEYEPNKKYGFKSLSGPIGLHTLYSFEIAHGGTHLTTSTQLSQNSYFKLPDSIVAKYANKQFEENLSKLKALLEFD